MPAHDRREHLDLVGREAAQLAVAHEVRASGGGGPLLDDVLADVVQQRGELEQLAVGVAEAVERRGRVEQLERELGDLARVRLGPVAAPARARRTDSRRIARGSSDQSAGSWRPTASSTMPSRSAHSRDGERVEVEQLHRGREEHRAGDDEVDAPGVEPVDAQALGGARRRGSPCAARGTRRA